MISWRPRRVARLRPHGRLLFATALGVSDGILNALTLASARILHGVGLDVSLGARVGVAAFASAIVTLFVAEYAQNRLELVRAERQLMFTRSGRLATTSLGRAVLRDAAAVAGVAGLASFAGAALPLAVSALSPRATWIAMVVSVGVLGALGIVLSTQVGGRRTVWALGLVTAGIAVTIIGVQVDLV